MNLHSGPESNPESSVNRPLPRSSYETKLEVSYTHTHARTHQSDIRAHNETSEVVSVTAGPALLVVSQFPRHGD
jgi:hypothetical protein